MRPMSAHEDDDALEPEVLPADAPEGDRPALPSGVQVGAVSGAAIGMALAGKGNGLVGAGLGALLGALVGAVAESLAEGIAQGGGAAAKPALPDATAE